MSRENLFFTLFQLQLVGNHSWATLTSSLLHFYATYSFIWENFSSLYLLHRTQQNNCRNIRVRFFWGRNFHSNSPSKTRRSDINCENLKNKKKDYIKVKEKSFNMDASCFCCQFSLNTAGIIIGVYEIVQYTLLFFFALHFFKGGRESHSMVVKEKFSLKKKFFFLVQLHRFLILANRTPHRRHRFSHHRHLLFMRAHHNISITSLRIV